jgi:hypothetical protein
MAEQDRTSTQDRPTAADPSTGRDRLVRAARFVWQNARVLEQRRFRHHFQTPDREGILTALAAYATDDGGYGFALEADGRGPSSQPLHVDFALKVLAEIGGITPDIADRICGYLASVSRADGGLPVVHEGIGDNPRAPWWVVDEGTDGALIPTASVVGLLLAADVEHPWLTGAHEFCWAGVDTLLGGADTHPYALVNALTFLDRVPAAERDRAAAAAARLGEVVRDNRWVLLDPTRPDDVAAPVGYAPGEFVLPHDYAPTPDSLARDWFSDEEFDLALGALAAEGEADGGWSVRWRMWAPAVEPEWRGWATVQALLTLRAFGR